MWLSLTGRRPKFIHISFVQTRCTGWHAMVSDTAMYESTGLTMAQGWRATTCGCSLERWWTRYVPRFNLMRLRSRSWHGLGRPSLDAATQTPL